ncbi:MAG: glycosyltransferase family 4 protein [Rubellimicrobium sp.]|nr:glycosyltransferase family 4 protein [Rubellimicrobium sp.]
MKVDASRIEVIAPNFKRRWSGVSSTVVRLVPLQAREIGIASAGPRLPGDVPRLNLWQVLTLDRRPRVWHARRNIEMLAGLALRNLLRKRLKLMFTSAAQRKHSAYTRWLIRRMDRVVATSARSAAFLRVPHVVLHHGIDTATFAPPDDRAALRRRLGLDPDAVILGCFGRQRPQKGTDLFVDAMIALLPERPGVQAIIMGGITSQFEGFVREQKAKVTAAGLSDRIRFLPEDHGFSIAPWFQAIDLYVAPQRHEGFGLTPLESMACGTPVVATTAGAFEELVVHEGTGLIVPAGDPQALQSAIARALDHPEDRARWAAACAPHVAQTFRIEAEAAALNAIYRELLAG